MKKLLALLFTALLATGLTACAVPAATSTTDGNAYEGEGFTITPPSGWYVTSVNEVPAFVHPEYPTVRNGILVNVGEKDPDFDSFDEAYFVNAYANSLPDFELLGCEETEVDGHSAFYLSYSYTQDETAMVQYQYLVDAPESSIGFTFLQVSGDMQEIMETVMESVTIQS